jgi:hypothetical protein
MIYVEFINMFLDVPGNKCPIIELKINIYFERGSTAMATMTALKTEQTRYAPANAYR